MLKTKDTILKASAQLTPEADVAHVLFTHVIYTFA